MLIPLQQILWTCCKHIFVINKQYLFLGVIFSNITYFCFNYTNTFFIHTMNYFSVVLRIMFLMCMGIGPRIIFRSIANLFWAYNVLWALQLKWTGSSLWLPWATILKTLKWRSAFKENATLKHCQGKKQKRFSSFLQNMSAASSLCVRDEVFWAEDLIKETMKRLHDSYTILTLIQHDMSAQLNSSLRNLIPRVFALYYTCWLLERRCGEFSAPYPELQEGSPNSNPDGGAWEQKSIKFPS